MESIEKMPHSQAYVNQRRLKLVLPLIILPFVTVLFWLFDGGSGTLAEQKNNVKGINTNLPAAENTIDSTLDKMAFYKKAEIDSANQAKNDSKDPYLSGIADKYVHAELPKQEMPGGVQRAPVPVSGNYGGAAYNDPNEAKIQQKLATLNASLNAASAPQPIPTEPSPARSSSGISTADVDRLEAMMNMQSSGSSTDPEMQQISSMLGQILDIQHPERVQEKLRASSAKARGQVFAVSANRQRTPVSLLDNGKKADSSKPANSFFSINENAAIEEIQNAIEAVVHETQTVTSGSVIKLRLLSDIFINGQLIPANTFLFGLANLNGERLNIEIATIRYGRSIFPVKLTLYDMDGLAGIYIPGAISREVAKNSADQALQSISLGANSIDPSVGMQAMGMGVEAAKGLLSKKVKLIKATLKAGYHVLLKDEKSAQ